MKVKEFDEAFDRGEDVTPYLDMSKARRPNLELKSVKIDFPVWMLNALDRRARQLGVTRESMIKFWLAERLARNDNG